MKLPLPFFQSYNRLFFEFFPCAFNIWSGFTVFYNLGSSAVWQLKDSFYFPFSSVFLPFTSDFFCSGRFYNFYFWCSAERPVKADTENQ